MNPAMRIVVLGSGGPHVVSDRGGPGVLVMVDDELLLFDCGRGTSTKIVTANRRLSSVGSVFLTHYFHYDHTCDLVTLAISGWMDGRSEPMKVYGPPGTGEFVQSLFYEAYRDDLNSRSGSTRPKAGREFICMDLADGQEVVNLGHWTVTAKNVVHGIRPEYRAIAYRVESYEGRSVAVSGDCRLCDGMLRIARGVDMLIAECSYMEDEGTGMGLVHMGPDEVGRLAADAGVGSVVLYHLGYKVDPEAACARIERVFTGRVVAARDLMQMTV